MKAPSVADPSLLRTILLVAILSVPLVESRTKVPSEFFISELLIVHPPMVPAIDVIPFLLAMNLSPKLIELFDPLVIINPFELRDNVVPTFTPVLSIVTSPAASPFPLILT